MLSPFVVEEHDGAFYVHHRGRYNLFTKQHEMGQLACDKPFKTYDEAQIKANDMELKLGGLW